RVAEPLMRDLVSDDAFNADGYTEARAHHLVAASYRSPKFTRPLIEKLVRKNNRAGIFHTAKASCGHDQGQLLVWIRRNGLAEKRDGRFGGRETFWGIIAITFRHVE